MIHERIHCIAEPEILSGDAQTRALQPICVEKLGVIVLHLCPSIDSHLVAVIRAGERAQQNCGITDTASHWAGGVLTVSDRNDSRPADKAESWLDPDNSIRRRRTHYGA